MLPQRKRFWAEVDLDVAEKNYNLIRSKLRSGVKLCCVVKANAYGHGAPKLARLYEELGADWFAVSNIEEAMQLRQHRIKAPILILGYTPPECAPLLSANNISQAVFSLDYAQELNSYASAEDMKVKIHIKIDSGMGRIGFSYKHSEKLGDPLHSHTSIEQIISACRLSNLIPEGVFTHFAVADEGKRQSDYTRQQFELFSEAVAKIEASGIRFDIKHAANSAATFEFSDFGLDMVRAGIVLYGLSPSPEIDCEGLSPVLSLRAVVSFVKVTHEGERISYGGDFVAKEGMKIATVPVGYADGYRRENGQSGGFMLINGKKAAIVGRICMDQLMLDVTDIEDVKRGDIVTAIGDDGGSSITADQLAKLCGTINYEILCGVGERVPRFYLRNKKIVAVKDSIISFDPMGINK